MAQGGERNSNYAELGSEVAVGSNGGLKIGMNTRLSITTQQRNNVFVVSSQAVTDNEYGKKVIYIATPWESGGYFARAVPVTTGMQTDRYIEIFAQEFYDGALVIKDTESIQTGTRVMPRIHTGLFAL